MKVKFKNFLVAVSLCFWSLSWQITLSIQQRLAGTMT